MIEFKPFDSDDWQTFGGCEAADASIAYFGDALVMIVDGTRLVLLEIDCDGDVVDEIRVSLLSPREAVETAKEFAKVWELLGDRSFRILWRAMCHAELAN